MTYRRFTRWLSVFLAAMLVLPGGALAQDPSGAQTQAQAKAFPQEQLDQLLAPVALYPDSLLTQLLMASTYPLEVVKANNWAKANKDLKGEELTKALEKQEWDPSVKSLVNFPQVLQMMSDKIEWTQKLGDAFLAQQKDVRDPSKTPPEGVRGGQPEIDKEQTVTVDNSTPIIVVDAVGAEGLLPSVQPHGGAGCGGTRPTAVSPYRPRTRARRFSPGRGQSGLGVSIEGTPDWHTATWTSTSTGTRT